MTRFDDLSQRVNLLNAQLQPLKDDLGSEARKILYNKLWDIVGELNGMLNLGLDNTALDLAVDGDRLLIHYWSGIGGSVESEVNVFIDRALTVHTHTKDLGTGNVKIT